MSFEPAKSPPRNIREVNANSIAIEIEEIYEILQDNMLLTQAD